MSRKNEDEMDKLFENQEIAEGLLDGKKEDVRYS